MSVTISKIFKVGKDITRQAGEVVCSALSRGSLEAVPLEGGRNEA